jgi:hypothetical protein
MYQLVSMGIDTKLRAHIRETLSARSFHQGFPNYKGRIIIDDVLTRVRNAMGPSFNHMFTGLELYREIMQPVRDALSSRLDACGYILLMDDHRNVPKNKNKEQEARDEASSISPYPDTKQYILTDEGIREFLPSLTTTTTTTTSETSESSSSSSSSTSTTTTTTITTTSSSSSGLSKTEKIDIRRLFATRSLRTMVFDYVTALISQYEEFPENKFLIVEYKMEGPQLFYTNYDRVNNIEKAQPIDTVWLQSFMNRSHKHGEADTSIIYYTELFVSKYPIVIRTTDTDMMPLFALFEERTRLNVGGNHIIWQYEREAWIDIILLIRDTCTKMKMTPKVFALLCILTGTDYYKKASVYYGFGAQKILQGVSNTQQYWGKFLNKGTAQDVEIFQRFLFALYGKYAKGYSLGSFLQLVDTTSQSSTSSNDYGNTNSNSNNTNNNNNNNNNSWLISASVSSSSSSSLPSSSVQKRKISVRMQNDENDKEDTMNKNKSARLNAYDWTTSTNNHKKKMVSTSSSKSSSSSTKKNSTPIEVVDTDEIEDFITEEKVEFKVPEDSVQRSLDVKRFTWPSFIEKLKSNIKLPSTFKLPTIENIQTAVEEITWNYKYWNEIPRSA